MHFHVNKITVGCGVLELDNWECQHIILRPLPFLASRTDTPELISLLLSFFFFFFLILRLDK